MKDPEMEKILSIYEQLVVWARRNGCGMEEALIVLKTIWLNNTKKLAMPKNGARE